MAKALSKRVNERTDDDKTLAFAVRIVAAGLAAEGTAHLHVHDRDDIGADELHLGEPRALLVAPFERHARRVLAEVESLQHPVRTPAR
mgnify:CR=1 FL=1